MPEYIEVGFRKTEFVSKNLAMELVQNCKRFIEQENLCDIDHDKILVAVSGGRDSVSLLFVLHELGYQIGIAHLNHQLRGTESDEEQAFIEQLAHDLDLEVHCKKVNIASIVDTQKKNLQEVARNERYIFFNDLVQEYAYTKIATAHHVEDNIESFLFQFSRGSGIRGLSGIPSQRGIIIRPFLGAKRSAIDHFIHSKSISYKEDSSNKKLNYKRNYLRHEVVPKLSQVHPNFLSNAQTSLHIMALTNAFYRDQMKTSIESMMEKTEKYYKIKKQDINSSAHGELILYEMLFPFGFNGDQVHQILRTTEGNGQMYYAQNYELLSDRDFWIMRKIEANTSVLNEVLHEGLNMVTGVGELQISFSSDSIKDLSTKYTAYLDASTLSFPLEIRNWKPGDYFYPLHMKGRKQKLKNYFVNKKLNRFEKDEVLIIVSNGEIIWLIGHRMDDRFKIKKTTEQACLIKYTPLH